MSRPNALLRILRLLHLYIGVFIAPALIFFAFTGALQTFDLHEASPNSTYKPPAWVMTLAQIHKKETPVVPPKRPLPKPAATPAPAATAAAVPAPPLRKHNPLPLKIFFLLVSVGLFVSTVSGIYMAWKYTRNKPLIAALLLAGIVIPVFMILI